MTKNMAYWKGKYAQSESKSPFKVLIPFMIAKKAGEKKAPMEKVDVTKGMSSSK
tara:strand:- start:4431 stop:4592 length:162 start_codon:yes stop_codon:yes gene_type:complete